MDSLDRRLTALVSGLTDRALAPHDPWTTWEETGRDQFELSLTKTTLKLSARDGDGTYPFAFTILDQNGRIVESVTAEREDEDIYNIGNLYVAIVRSSRGIDQKLTEIMDELKIDEGSYLPPEPPPF